MPRPASADAGSVANPDLPEAGAPRSDQASDADIVALRYLQQTHLPALISYLTRLAKGDVQQAEDVAQETMVRAWRNPDARHADGHWSRPWLFTVAKRILIDHLRSADVRPQESPIGAVDVLEDPDDAFDRLLDAREVRAALESLPERWRRTLEEMFFRERSVAEAAVILNVPEGTIKSRTYHAVRAMREALISRGFEFRPRGQGDQASSSSAPGRPSPPAR